MTIRESLYTILGIEKGATSAEIKKAFKRKSMEHHPDKGGDTEQFHLVCIAGEVLRNHRRKTIYDETGVYDDGPEPESRAEQLVVDAFFTVYAGIGETEIMYSDILIPVRKHLRNKIVENDRNILLWKKNCRLQEKVIKKIRFNKKAKGKGLIITALKDNLEGLRNDIHSAESLIEELKEAVELSEEYGYDFEEMPKAPDNGMGMGRPFPSRDDFPGRFL